jgi:uroporphyrinogen decarboxylase
MTPRERIRKAVNHQVPDRIPIDTGGIGPSGICADAYIGLAKYLKIEAGTPKVYNQFGMFARIDNKIRDRLHIDTVLLENPCESWGIRNRNWKKWKTGGGNTVLMPSDFNPITDDKGYIHLKNSEGDIIATMPPEGIYFERACNTDMSENIVKMDPSKWRKWTPPGDAISQIYTDEHLNELARIGKFLYENTNYAIVGGFNQGMLGHNGLFAGHTITDWMIILMTEPQYAYEILEATAQRAIDNLKGYLQAVGDYLEVILVSTTDWGTQESTLFAPEVYRYLYVTNIKKITDYVHKNCRAKTLYHSDGAIRNFLPYFVEAGIDIYDPVAYTLAGMDLIELKKEFGNKLVFWGAGADGQSLLRNGTKEQVVEQTKKNIDILSKNGGFVFAPNGPFQPGDPPENFAAMLDFVYEHGKY